MTTILASFPDSVNFWSTLKYYSIEVYPELKFGHIFKKCMLDTRDRVYSVSVLTRLEVGVGDAHMAIGSKVQHSFAALDLYFICPPLLTTIDPYKNKMG